MASTVAPRAVRATSRRATISEVRSRSASMSISANVVVSRSSGWCRMSPTRLRVKTVEPAPMNAIFGIRCLPRGSVESG